MARSFYKGENLGSVPACAICVGKGQGKRERFHLPGGVSVWLCAAHRDPSFTLRRAGRDLVASLMHVWRSADALTAARSRALDLFQERLRTPAPGLPGSYSWPTVRLEAEARWAAGEAPGPVIDDLRSRELERPSPARPPSVATMRRWFRQGRWGAGPAPRPSSTPPPPPRHPRRARPLPSAPGPAASASGRRRAARRDGLAGEEGGRPVRRRPPWRRRPSLRRAPSPAAPGSRSPDRRRSASRRSAPARAATPPRPSAPGRSARGHRSAASGCSRRTVAPTPGRR